MKSQVNETKPIQRQLALLGIAENRIFFFFLMEQEFSYLLSL